MLVVAWPIVVVDGWMGAGKEVDGFWWSGGR